MAKQYIIKFLSGELSQPLDDEGVKLIIQQKALSGSEDIKNHPDGEWEKLREHSLYKSFIKQPEQEATFIRKLSDFGDIHEATKFLNEVDEDEYDPDKTEVFPAEFTVSVPKPEVVVPKSPPKPPKNIAEDEATRVVADIDENIEHEATRVRPDTIKYLEKLKREEASKKREEELKKKELENKVEEKIDYNHEKTQVLSLDVLKNDLGEAEKAERDLAEIQKQKLERERKALHKNKQSVINEDLDEKSAKEKKRKKLIYTVVIIAFLVVLLFPDEGDVEDNKVVTLSPVIQFPIEYEKPNPKKANELFRKGVADLNKYKYIFNVRASKTLKQAVEWDISNKAALNKLFLANAMILDESQSKFKDANTTFKIFKIIPGTPYTDIDRVKGLAYFYKSIEKMGAGLNVLEKFSRTQNNPSFEVYALWLDLLIENAQLSKAREVYEQLEKAVSATKSPEYFTPMIFHSLANYQIVQSQLEKANEWLNQGIKIFPDSVRLLLDKVKVYMLSQDTSGMRKYLIQVDKLSSGNKSEYYAEFLKYTGFFKIFKGDTNAAAALFQQSLQIRESSELRAKLASLKPSGENKVADELIKQSAAIAEYNKAKNALDQDKWREALTYITKAVDLYPEYVPARILFSKLQMRNGFYEQAIKDLQEAINVNTRSPELYFALLEVYIKLYKFNEAKSLVNMLSNSDMRSHPELPSLLSKMYLRMGDKLSGANWLVQSLNKNPLNDKDYYELAKVYMKANRFEEARKFLNRAIELEPFNVKYRAAYAQYLYDSKGPEVAVGYLLDLMKDENFENEKAYLVGEMGIYYYRAGKIENFQDTRNRLEQMDYPRKNLYEYVIRTSLIDGDYENLVINAKALLEIEPGDIETRMLLGRIYFEQEKYELALREFKNVKDMMKSYPRLKYYIAKAHLSIGDRDKAYEMAKEEVKSNPHLADGYILIGDIGILNEKWVESERNYRKALQIEGNSFDAVMGLAYINFKKNKQDSALTLYKKAQQLDPSNPEVYRMLGEIYRLLGQGRKAIENYRIYLKRVPESKYKAGIDNYIKIMQ